MNCIIDNSITYLLKQGKKAQAIRNYLKDRYRITVDLPTIRKRIEQIRQSSGGSEIIA